MILILTWSVCTSYMVFIWVVLAHEPIKAVKTGHVVTWLAVAASRPVKRLLLFAAHRAAAPDKADGGRRKEQECKGREGLNCPASEMDWRERMSTTKE